MTKTNDWLDLPTVIEIQQGNVSKCDSLDPDRLPTLILIHPGAGMSACYAKLSFRPDRRVIAINQTWLADPNPIKFDNVQTAAKTYLEYLQAEGWLDFEIYWQNKLQKPAVALGGWSYGGSVACEMAYQIAHGQHRITDYSGLLLFDTVHPVNIYDYDSSLTKTGAPKGSSSADQAILCASKIQAHDSKLMDYLRLCYNDATRLLSTYSPDHIHVSRPVTMIKAGKMSSTDRSLSSRARIQRVKNQLCSKNGWTHLCKDQPELFLTLPLPDTTHDELFMLPHFLETQTAIDTVELQRRI